MAIELISNITPKNNGKFPLVDAKDVQVDGDGTRLDAVLMRLSSSTVIMAKSEYNAALEAGELDENKIYLVTGDADG